MSTVSSDRRVDLTDTELFVHGDPHRAWRWLRDNAPVYWNADDSEQGGFWALTRYDDLMAAYRDPVTFSSREGTVIGGSFRSERDTASGQMIICSDPPAHRQLRQQVHRGFEQKLVRRIRQRVAESVEQAVERMVADGGCDVATDLAPELPVAVLAEMFGLDRADAFTLLELSRDIIGYQDHLALSEEELSQERLRLVGAHARLLEWLMLLIEKRRRSPGDDLPSALLAGRLNGRPLSLGEMLYNCLNVVVGGNETTPYTACAGIAALIEFPEQQRRLHEDPGLLPTAVDEILRWTSTNAYVGRTLTRDLVLHDTQLQAGQRVTLWNAAANRDERQFQDADTFDVGRQPNHHLAFGAGNHRCIGQYVAREEVTALFTHLTERKVRLALDGPIHRLRSNFMQGTTSMPVRVLSADRAVAAD
jgi:cytochrome P450